MDNVAEQTSAAESTAQNQNAIDNRQTRSAHDTADTKVAEATQKVKSQLVPEISALNQQFEAMVSQNAEYDGNEKKFNVSNPIKMEDQAGLKIGYVIKYTVTGQDSQGPFEIQRRYNEFLALQNALNTHWPGCYIPAIPEKQLLGDKDDGFVEERRQLLERFI